MMAPIADRLIKGTAYSLFASVSTKLILMVNSVLVARLLGPENLGIWAILSYLQSIALMFAVIGVSSACVKFISEFASTDKKMTEELISTSITLILLFATLTCIVYFLFSDYIAVGIYNNPLLATLIKISSFTVFIASLTSVFGGIIHGFQEIKLLSKVIIIKAVITLIVLLPLIYIYGLVGAIVGLLIAEFCYFVLIFKYALDITIKNNISIKLGLKKILIKKLLNYGFPSLLGGLVVTPAALYAASILALSEGFVQVGLFRVANTLSNYLMFIPLAMSVPLFPIISELHANNSKKLSKVISKSFKFVALITLPVAVGLGLFSKMIIPTIYGEAFYDAWQILYLMSATMFLLSTGTILGNVFSGTGKMWQGFGVNFLWMIVFVGASHYFVGLYGLIGLGYAYLISYISHTIVQLTYFDKKLNIKFSGLKFLFSFASLTFLVSYMILTTLDGFIYYLISSTFMLVLIICDYFILTKNEKKLLFQHIKNSLRWKKK